MPNGKKRGENELVLHIAVRLMDHGAHQEAHAEAQIQLSEEAFHHTTPSALLAAAMLPLSAPRRWTSASDWVILPIPHGGGRFKVMKDLGVIEPKERIVAQRRAAE